MFENMCLVLDLGGGQSPQIARKVRGEKVYCEVLPYDAPLERILKRAPRGLIVAGGTGDPYAEQALKLPEYVYGLNLPMLGIGYGAGVLLRHEGGRLKSSVFGRGTVEVTFGESPLFEGLTSGERLLERLDDVELPPDMRGVAEEADGLSVAFEQAEKRMWGMQFSPEQNDPDGLQILHNFAVSICGCAENWTIDYYLGEEVKYIRDRVGDGRVLMAVSGGVDSSVCAALLNRAIGDRLTCLYVDTGFMRENEMEDVRETFAKLGIRLCERDARARFLARLAGVLNSELKRALVMDELAGVVEDELAELPEIGILSQGITYDDALYNQPTADAMHLHQDRNHRFTRLLEPVSRLFKEEVRLLGEAMDLPQELTRRQAFPGAGLALRCLGEVTEKKLTMLRQADRIFREEIEQAGLAKRIRQFFAILTDLSTGDVTGRQGRTVALRAVNWNNSFTTATAYRLPYDLLERVTERMTTEIEGVNRVVYDITNKPPAGIEWD